MAIREFFVHYLRCEYKENPLFIDSSRPALSWEIHSSSPGFRQQAYQILAATSEDLLHFGTPDLWNSERVESCQQFSILYEGIPLESQMSCYWSVKVWNSEGEASEWSKPAYWKMGLTEDDWKAEWIGYDEQTGPAFDSSRPYFVADNFDKGKNVPYLPPVRYLRKEFNIEDKLEVKDAVLYVSALGLTEIEINGEKVGEEYFTPGWSDYRKRVYYRAFSVTELLHTGMNAIGSMLADGWYAGYIGLNPRNYWGENPRLKVQLEIKYQNSSETLFFSDKTWKASHGPLLYSDIMHGEKYDSNKALGSWSSANFADGDWNPVDVDPEFVMAPTAHPGEPVVCLAEIAPTSMEKTSNSRTMVDIGQCLSGVLKVTAHGPGGAEISIRHAEELDDKGELYVRANRSASATDIYILSGDQVETYQPRFTYHGFRYAEISVSDESVSIESVSAIALGSGRPRETIFDCSSQVANGVFDMVRWTSRSNQFEVPTDVCARDERLGWGADGQFFMHTAVHLFDNTGFLRKWFLDIVDSQQENDCYWPTAPAVTMEDIRPFAGDLFSDSAIHVAWLLVRMYGDCETVRNHYSSLYRYFQFLTSNQDRFLRFSITGDWLSLLDKKHTDYYHGFGSCPRDILGTAYFACSALLMSEIARELEIPDDSAYYQSVLEKIKKAFSQTFLLPDGSLKNGTQTAYILAIYFDLVPVSVLDSLSEHLVNLISSGPSFGLDCGMAGMPYALPALSKIGRTDLASRIIVSEEFPSFGFMRKMGATTVWERWDGRDRQGRFHPHPMNAFNHIGFATVGEWFISDLIGIKMSEPGYTELLISPGVSREITSASAEFNTMKGPISIKWDWKEMHLFTIEVKLPPNAEAVICVPSDHTEVHRLESYGNKSHKAIRNTGYRNGCIELKAGSGEFIVETLFSG